MASNPCNSLQIKTTISSKQADAREPQEQQVAIHYLASFHELCVVTALLPLVTLFTCFVTAYVFQYDDVHETHCRVSKWAPGDPRVFSGQDDADE